MFICIAPEIATSEMLSNCMTVFCLGFVVVLFLEGLEGEVPPAGTPLASPPSASLGLRLMFKEGRSVISDRGFCESDLGSSETLG
mmetsp:Transcript_51318/g.111365  ORF Transcript_51318/g.111365 Transcript_51318/m.111365 type:complete len:85 (-) Transcript_51318:293-547(-)